MKKLISLTLALLLVFSLATVASAESVTYSASDPTSFDIEKDYVSDENFVPGETLSFTITADASNPDYSKGENRKMITIGTDNTFTVTGLNNKITVNVPSYEQAGVYKYTITEQQGNTAGVTYDTTTEIHVSVLVQYDNTNKKLVIGNPAGAEGSGITYYFIDKVDNIKDDDFSNKFDTGDFKISKKVQGNMANRNDKFEVTVTLVSTKPVLTPISVGGTTIQANDTNWEESIDASGTKTYTYTWTQDISHSDGEITFADIPVGVSVKVEETEDAMGDYELYGYVSTYTADISKQSSTAAKTFTIADTNDDVIIVNNNSTSVDTGITLDSIPFILILAVCAGAVVLFVVKRRRSVDF